MLPNAYCPFCGVILLPDPYDDEPASSETRVRPWYAEARGIYPVNTAIGDVAITGIGIVRHRNLYAPFDSGLSYVDEGIETLQEWRVCKTEGRWNLIEPSENRWCFGFHNSCWRLLLLRLGHGQDDSFHYETAIAEMIFYQLYCIPCPEGSVFTFGHDYEGAAKTHKSFGRPKAVDLSSHFYADPCTIPSTDRLQTAAPPDSARVKELGTLGRPKNYAFKKLSLELKFEILSYLSFDELLNMRHVCRDLALLATVDKLPPSYWRSRFSLGQEADFLFPNLKASCEWNRLFFGTRASLSAKHLPMVNRKRIRKLLEPIAALVELKTFLRDDLYGYSFHPTQSQGSHFQLIDGEMAEQPPRLMKVTGSFSGQLASARLDSALNEGCRALYHRAHALLPPFQPHRQRIGITTVHIGARGFISGINLFVSVGCNDVDRRVGYRNTASEKWIEIPSGSQVNAVCVAFRAEGLTGIKFIFTNSDSSDWVGDNNNRGIAHGTLNIPEDTGLCYLLASLDCFKIVALGLGESINGTEDSLKLTLPSMMDSSHVQSHLWAPPAPDHEDVKISSLLPSQLPLTFEPLINIDFGGRRGLYLGSLKRLTFYISSIPYAFVGIEISYSDGKSVVFGSNSGCEISFFIDGSKGERINRLGIIEHSHGPQPETGLCGLQISTNYGRTTTLASLRDRVEGAAVSELISPPDSTITGLTAVELENRKGFLRVGIQSQKCDEEPIIPNILDRKCHQVPDDEIRYDKGFSHFIGSSHPGNCQTYASLKNVRRIQASTGMQGRSRSTNCISGLKLEYYNHPSPGAVGQWMNELDRGFELSPDEEVQSLIIWLTPVGFSSGSPGMEVGQVTAIHIETTYSRSVTFRSPGFDSLPHKTLQYRYQVNYDEELTAISWILNISSDCVRAVISANETWKSSKLVPERPPYDPVQKLYFETQNKNGCRDSMAAAEAYFQGTRIVGFVFVYASGTRARVGDISTDFRQTVYFARGVRIIGFSAGIADGKLMEVGFEVEQKEQPRYKMTLSINPFNTVDVDWRDVWCEDRAFAGTSKEHFSNRDRVYKLPSRSMLVGIYARCQEFSHVGALYQ